jgi:hypothetical protein
MTVMTVEDRLTLGARLARLHFPDAAGKIEHRLRRDDDFSDMCEELADLDRAIMGGTRRDGVLAEWIAARDRLVQDMADALAKVERDPDRKGPSRSGGLGLCLLSIGAGGLLACWTCFLMSSGRGDMGTAGNCPIREIVAAAAGVSSLSRER